MPTGILLLDKPAGLSSNAALQRVRRLFGARKAGHAGSLDPLATGMLPICLDEATKVVGEIVSGRKRYRFTLALGTRTTTGDLEGEPIERAAVPPLDLTRVGAVIAGHVGRRMQIPPMFSALKRHGRPLYQLAREGIEVERAARPIEIFALTLLGAGAEALELETVCSKGTYVRTLAEELARALGTCGHVGALRRESVEPFEDEPMHTLDALAQACERGSPPPLLPPDRALGHLPEARLDAAAADRIRHGQTVLRGEDGPQGRVRLYDERDEFFGIGEADGRGGLRARRLLVRCEAPRLVRQGAEPAEPANPEVPVSGRPR
jgi:tRNA pseudouridine55 synthase